MNYKYYAVWYYEENTDNIKSGPGWSAIFKLAGIFAALSGAAVVLTLLSGFPFAAG